MVPYYTYFNDNELAVNLEINNNLLYITVETYSILYFMIQCRITNNDATLPIIELLKKI